MLPVPILVILLAAGAQTEPPAAPSNRQTADRGAGATFRTESNLALVRFQVIVRKNDHVENLRADEIELREDGVPQRIAVFEGGKLYPRTTKIDVHLLFDCSESTHRAKVLDPHVFSKNLLDEFPNVRIAMWGFSTVPVESASGKRMVKPVLRNFARPTRDPALLMQGMDAVNGMEPGRTPLYRVLVGLLGTLSPTSDSASIVVVVSDGMPVGDVAGPEDVAKAARKAGVSIFPALVNAQFALPAFRSGNEPLDGTPRLVPAQAAFRDLGQATGGVDFVFEGKPPNDLLDSVLKRLAEQIRYEYVAGYSPDRSAGEGLHKIQVVLKNRNRGQVIGGERDVER